MKKILKWGIYSFMSLLYILVIPCSILFSDAPNSKIACSILVLFLIPLIIVIIHNKLKKQNKIDWIIYPDLQWLRNFLLISTCIIYQNLLLTWLDMSSTVPVSVNPIATMLVGIIGGSFLFYSYISMMKGRKDTILIIRSILWASLIECIVYIMLFANFLLKEIPYSNIDNLLLFKVILLSMIIICTILMSFIIKGIMITYNSNIKKVFLPLNGLSFWFSLSLCLCLIFSVVVNGREIYDYIISLLKEL